MIQVRMQYNNVYLKILDGPETFDHTLEKVRYIRNRGFNMETGEWMFDREYIGDLLALFDNQITWMTPLHEIVAGVNLNHEIVNQHIQWESEGEFKNFLLPLYAYQKVGANFLIDRGCAAVFDGCGLGKTPQLIGACEKLHEQGRAQKMLIVTLSSLKRQWAKEIEKFSGKTAIAVSGTPAKRASLIKGFAQRKDIQYMVINYEILRNDTLRELIKNIPFDVVALDEAQKIKNGVRDTSLNMEPSQIAAAAYELKHIKYRFVATATPLQGKAEEIFSIFYFLNEEILGPWNYFRERYCKYSTRYGITGYINLGELYYRIAPFFIRRTKDMPEIQQQLPQVQHSHVFLEMTDAQEKLHDYLIEKLTDIKEQARSITDYKFINGQSMSPQEAKEYYDALAQGYQSFLLSTCDSPELLLMSKTPMAEKILKEVQLSEKDLKSPKIDQFKEFFSSMLYDEPNSKVVIFSRFERMVELLYRELNKDSRGRPLDNPIAVAYHGQLTEGAKEYAKEQFLHNPNIKAIICTDAGSTGLNLQVANYMVHIDLPWDPTLLEQRNGRIDRTGNAFANVTIYYYAMENSFDEHLLEILDRKSDLANQVLTGGADNRSRERDVNKLAMDRLLRKRNKQTNNENVG
ncbi:Helicase conserved C-terminal domain-containing protein [Paenibacillus sp. UNC496MF]|uniref:DEAD/DEAH box helicase n=1 Tax=Paenibacillus sp. UNC496MF TaxID=1502753 RepID=UPI0008DF3D8F|nr:DEAD/DEAH box helicase [Paenibacillus sp. UNC496MF]SFJ63290.1 Helicase conserved C-terminal domain-containing protein [Paenibacillus sp. UNC496MF]